MKYGFLIFIVCVFHSGMAQTKVKKVEFFYRNLYAHRPIKMSLNDISSDVNFVGEATDGPIINAVNSFVENIRTKKPQKSKRFNDDNLVVLVLIYEDGTPGFISGNKGSYILYDQKVYKDDQYNFLTLINAYVNIPSIRRFLEEKKILPVGK